MPRRSSRCDRSRLSSGRPHKPVGFVEAVQAIHRRLAKLHASDAPTDREARRRQSDELKDIIQWLPELAAETDLRKADWDAVNASSKRMALEWDEIAPRLIDHLPETIDASLRPLERELEALDRLAKRLSDTVAASGGRAPIR